MVTGYDEAVEVFHDSAAFSSCISVTGPFPGFPVPLDGDDVGELIERHRHELPMNDQLPTLDPPVHTAHRALLMKLITPKRLKENEASMWQLADRILDEFLAGGEGEFVSGFAGPFTLLVIADLLGVPEEDREEFLDMLQRRPRSGVIGSTGEDTLTHSPLELLYGRFTAYIEDSRRQPRGDVLTGLATATFPDGSVPEKGDRVVLNGWGVGETHWGGLAQRARLNGDWLVPLPPNFTAWHAMAIGTAGYTASLCVGALLDHGVRPDQGEILVTGATGGVGSIAVALLAKAGFTVAAATGKPSEAGYLQRLGAATVLDRAEFAGPGKPLHKERWAGCRRLGRQPHAGERLCADPLRRDGRGVRSGPRHGFPCVSCPVHPARGIPARHRQRDGALSAARGRLGPPVG